MRKMLLLLVVMLPVGFAQIEAYVFDVAQEVDRFDGSTSCSQRVDNGLSDDHGIRMFTSSEIPQAVVALRNEVSDWSYDSAWLSTVTDDDLVYVLFPSGEVETYTPDAVNYDFDTDSEYAAIVSDALAYRLLSTPGDIEVRFDGPDGQVDFTIYHEVLIALAEGFGQACLD